MRVFLVLLLALPGAAWGLGSGTTTTRGATPLFQAPLSRPGLIPSDLSCTDGTPAVPVLRCGVPEAEDRWACFGRDGAEVPVTQGTGTTYEDGPWGRAAVIDTTARSPKITEPSADLRNLWTRDHTVIVVGRPGDTSATRRLFTHGAADTAGFYMLATAALQGVWSASGSNVTGTPPPTTDPRGKYGVFVALRVGTNYSLRVGSTTTNKTAEFTPEAPAPGEPIYFGAGPSGSMAGFLYTTIEWDCGLSDDSLARLEAQVYGARASDGRPITTTRAGPAWCDGGWQVGDNAPCVSGGGLESRGATLNYWTNSTTPNAWTVVNTPAATLQADGSYLIQDDSSAFEGYRLNYSGAVGETWTLACDVKADTLSSVSLLTSSVSPDWCTGVSLTGSGWQRVSCSKTLTSVATEARVYVGGAAGDTGTVFLRQCQLEKSPTPGRRCDAGASPTTCPGDQPTVSTAGWPVSSGWCELDYAPSVGGSDASFLLSAEIFNTVGWSIYRRNGVSLAFIANHGGTPANTVHDGSPLPWTVGAIYRIRAEWNSAAVRIWRGEGAGPMSLVTNSTLPNRPAGPLPATGSVGTRWGGGSGWANGSISNIRCGRL